MKDRLKALFIPFAPSLAHVSRCLAVAEAWQARGHTAVFAIGEERRALVESAGFETRAVPEAPRKRVLGDMGFFSWLTEAYITDNIAAERRIIAEAAPDVIVNDFRFTACLSARLAGLPSASILHGSALRFSYQPRADTARLMIGDVHAVRGRSALQARILRRFFPFAYRQYMMAAVRRLGPQLKPYIRSPIHSVFELLLGDMVIGADFDELMPPELPPCTHTVGPLLWSGWERPAPWLDGLDERPLVYVTMGSTVRGHRTLAKILRALDDGAYNVVASTGSVLLPGGLELSPRVRVFPTVPGATVARRSVAVVHPGGHETLMQALSAGVPSLILPTNPDQNLVGQQSQALGLGESLWRPGSLPFSTAWQNALSPMAIRTALDGLLDKPGCMRSCQAFRQKLHAYRGAALAVENLEDLVQEHINNE